MTDQLIALRNRVAGLAGDLSDYSDQRRIEYELARIFPPMADPTAFLRDARDPATFDHIVKMDIYDSIPRWTASLDATAALTERLLTGWQWVVWGGAIEVGQSKPRVMASIRDGSGCDFDVNDAPTPALALLLALLNAKIAQAGEAG